MTASKHCKALCGLSLAEVSRRIGKPRQTLENWYRDNLALFEVVCRGCVTDNSIKWISVKDRLPDQYRQSEVVFYVTPFAWRTGMYTPDGLFGEQESGGFEYHQYWGDDKYHTVEGVTHWMELPRPE